MVWRALSLLFVLLTADLLSSGAATTAAFKGDVCSQAVEQRTQPINRGEADHAAASCSVRGGSTWQQQQQTTTKAMTNMVSSSSFLPTILPWWQALFHRPKQYRQALEEQIQWLEQQLRQVVDEIGRLEKQQQQQQALTTTSSLPLAAFGRADRKRLAQTLQLRERLQALQEQFADLASAKQALEDLLEDQQRQIDHLAEECQQAHHNRQDMAANYYEAQVEELTHRMHQQTQDQLAAMDQLWQARLEQAQQDAREQVWREGKERLAKLAADLSDRYQAELHAERLKTHQAIETQRQKMRSLAKGMAIREKQLYQQQQLDLLQDQERQRVVTLKLQEQRRIRAEMEQARLEEEAMKVAQEREQLLLQRQQEQERLALEEQERVKKRNAEERERLEQQQQQQKETGETTNESWSAASPPGLLQRAQEPLQKALDHLRKATQSSKGKPTKPVTIISSPVSTYAKAANWQRRVPWQPGLPPMDTLR